MAQKLWHSYIWKRQTLNDLAETYGHSLNWVKKQLALAQINKTALKSQSGVIVIDATYEKRNDGWLMIKDAHTKQILTQMPIQTETTEAYSQIRQQLENTGYDIKAVVLDGRRGALSVFSDKPIQFCHFHQCAIIKRYLTQRPKLEAGQELRLLSLALPKIDKATFELALAEWVERWQDFLNEKSYNPETKRNHYTHKRLRSAYRSLKTNLPRLFTYQIYPELKIPNTTNCLDGYFKSVKELLHVHNGVNKFVRDKIIIEILTQK